MNYKNLYIFLTFITFTLMALSSPIKHGKDKIFDENSVVEISDSEISNGESSCEEHDNHSKFIKLPNDGNSKFIKHPNDEKPKIIKYPNSGNPKVSETPNVTEVPDVTENPDVIDVPDTTDVPELTEENVCNTPKCKSKAESILYAINFDVDPCDNFYEYACGNWEKNVEIPEGLNSITINERFSENLKIISRAIDEGYKVNENLTLEEQKYDKLNFDKVADFYHSCMDMETLNAKGFQPILDLFEKMNIDDDIYNENKYYNVEEFTNFLARFDNYGTGLLFDINIYASEENPEYNSIFITQPEFGLKIKKNYENNDIVTQYKSIIKYVFDGISKNQKDKNIDKIVESVLELEMKLINITLSNEDINNQYYQDDFLVHHNSIKYFNMTSPFMDWKNYFNKRIDNLGIDKSFYINEDTIIINITPSYFEKLKDIIKETDRETIINFAKWNFVRVNSIFLGSDILKVFDVYNRNFNSYYSFIDYSDDTRDDYCRLFFYQVLIMGASKIFVDASFEKENINIIRAMSDNIHEVMNKRMLEEPWLDDETRKNAVRKSEAINIEIGYPEYMMEPKELYLYYENLEISANDFLNNIISNNIYEIIKAIKKHDKPVDKEDWPVPPFEFNSYYFVNSNSILMLAGHFQEPVYSASYPNYLNYGGVGFYIGHEITHAFDNIGRLYDYDGSLNNWWTEPTENAFNLYSQCFIKQYSDYTFTDTEGIIHNNNGNLTLRENIADNGGISNSYDAWRLSLENDPDAKEKNKDLPGLSQFTHDQLFFISFGQTWCEKMKEDRIIYNMEYESHPISKFRVLGSLTNNDNFAKAFNCPTGSPMNPENKCKIL